MLTVEQVIRAAQRISVSYRAEGEDALDLMIEWWATNVSGNPEDFSATIDNMGDAEDFRNFATVIAAGVREGWQGARAPAYMEGHLTKVVAMWAWDVLYWGITRSSGRKDWRPRRREEA